MKKFLLVLLAVICTVCLGAAAACTTNNGDFYKLVFVQANGVHYSCDIPSGMEVRAGTEVRFSITVDDEAEGTPVVHANDELLEADNGGVYSFTIEEATYVWVSGVVAEGEYNRLVYTPHPGASCEFLTMENGTLLSSGMMVKKGTNVSFRISVKEGYYCYPGDEPVVIVNGETLEDEDGVYSFIMNVPTEIKVDGVTKNLGLTFNAGDVRVRYINENGTDYPTDTTYLYKMGDIVKFRLQISVYYKQEVCEVQANTTILTPDDDGFYTVVLEDDTNITVGGLELDQSFSERADGGAGTAKNPFRISRPIDLYQLATLVNSGFYDTLDTIWRTSYYELENDIDMQGEQLFVIGDRENDYAVFLGNFNGNGHTISNYYIINSIVEQEEFQTMILTSVGLFGYMQPYPGRNSVISNLNLDNFSIYADFSLVTTGDYTLSVGSLVGSAYGVSVVGCSATNGVINVTGSQRSVAYVGGLIGQQVSGYSAESNISAEAGVISCMTDVDINITAGISFVYATGGITGLLGVGNEYLPAYILNSYSLGDIEGGLHAGGIAGYASNYTSVINCYSSGAVIANSPFPYSDNYVSEVYYAYAGGIVGYAGYDSVIYSSFSNGYIYASAERGSNFAKGSSTVARIDGENSEPDLGYNAPSLINLHGSVGMTIDKNLMGTLNWGEEDWTLDSGKLVLNKENTKKQFTVNFSVDNGFGTAKKSYVIDSQYRTMADWNNQKDRIPEYMVGDNGNRSYGYFFDSELKYRVPRSFIPTHIITLFIGYANYAAISGTYYLGESVESGAMIELEEDGTFIYRNGALNHASVYTWDNTTLVLYNTVIGELTEVDLGNDELIIAQYFSMYYSFGATIENGVMKITGGSVEEIALSENGEAYYTENIITLFPSDKPLMGLKAIEGLRYGEYYADNGSTIYTFNGNGTGRRVTNVASGNENIANFTFSFGDSGVINIVYANDLGNDTAKYENGMIKNVGSVTINPYDGFAGVWEADFNFSRIFNFNGIDVWTYTVNGSTNSGKYTINEGVLTDTQNAFTAKVNEEGYLEITIDGKTQTYYRDGSFAGKWSYSGVIPGNDALSIEIVFYGIGREGYGKAIAEYADGSTTVLTYDTEIIKGTKVVTLYNNATVFAAFDYDESKVLLTGTLNGRKVRFTLYDTVIGTWISDNDDISEAVFNGNGLYNLSGDTVSGAIGVNGKLTINRKKVNYIIDRITMKGSFTYSNITYSFEYDQASNVIKVTAEGGVSFTLQPRDEWYKQSLKDAEGNVYTFENGRGRLEKGGRMSVYESSGSLYNEYTYKINDDESISLTPTGGSLPGTVNATITVGDHDGHKVFVWTEDNGYPKYFVRHTAFTGSWIVGGTKGELEIGEVYADNTAMGSYSFINGDSAENVAFTYNTNGSYLSFTYINGETYYINALTVDGESQLSIGPDNSMSGDSNSVCISEDLADEWRDDFYWIYDETTNENIGRLVFDGLGGSGKVGGIATYYGLDSNSQIDHNNIVALHGYEKNEWGYARLKVRLWEYLLIPCPDADSLKPYEREVLYLLRDADYEEDGDKMYGEHYFAVVYPDELYEEKIRDASEYGVTYEFNGVGTVVRITRDSFASDAVELERKIFTYKITNVDIVNFIHTLEFTDEEGNVYTVTLDQSGTSASDYTISMKPKQ